MKKKLSSHSLKLLRAGIWVSLGIALGRLSGFAREALIAARLGATASADVAVLILTIPDLLLSLLVGGAIEAALIPRFQKVGRSRAAGLFVEVSVLVFSVSLLAVGVLWFFAQSVVTAFAPGFSPSAIAQSTELFRITVFTLPLTALVAVSAPYLRVLQHFSVPAFGNVLFNLCLVLVLLSRLVTNWGEGLAWAAVIGAAVRWFSQLLVLIRLNPFRGMEFGAKVFDRGLWISYAEALLGGVVLVFLPVVGRIFSSFEDPGAYAILSYSLKFVELPLGVGLTAFSVVLLPRLAELFQSSDSHAEGEALAINGFLILFIASIAIMLGLGSLIQLLGGMNLSLGLWTGDQFRELCWLTTIGVLALPARGLTTLVQTIMNARGDTRSSFVINLLSLVIFVGAARWGQQKAGMRGLAWALVAIYWLMLVLHLVVLEVRHRIALGKMLLRLRTLGVAGATAGGFVVFQWFGQAILPMERVWGVIVMCCISGAAGLICGVVAVPRFRAKIFGRRETTQ